jgi:hypothetical protein
VKLLAVSIAGACVVALAAAERSARPADSAASCARPAGAQTTLIIDGDLYALIRSDRRPNGYLGGWSGTPATSISPLLRLVRAFGLDGTPQQLLRLRKLQGGRYGQGGSIAYFDLQCRGSYRVIALARGKGPVRFWLQEQRGTRQTVTRAFCMRPQALRKGALLMAKFSAPLTTAAPTFSVDRDGNGTNDLEGRFRSGGGSFPKVTPRRCV